MRLTVIGAIVLAMAGLVAGSHGPVGDTLTVEVGMDEFGEDFHAVHPEAGVVTFVAAYSNVPRNDSEGYRREPAMYDNTSLERWAAMQGNDKGIWRIGQLIAERYGNQTVQHISAGVTSTDGHEYLIEIHPSSSNLTVGEIRRVVPDEIEARVQYPHDTVTVVMPVAVTEQDLVIGQSGSALYDGTAPEKDRSFLSTVMDAIRAFLDWLTFW